MSIKQIINDQARRLAAGPSLREQQLEESLRQTSGKLAEIEALYRADRRYAQQIDPQIDAVPKYAEGVQDGMMNVLVQLDTILHPMDTEGFVQVGDDRG